MGGCCTKCVAFWQLPDGVNDQNLKSNDFEKGSTPELPLAPIVQKGKPAAHQWVRFKDDISQSIFWHNAATGETLSDENFPPKKPNSKNNEYEPPSAPSASPPSPKSYRPPSPPPMDSDDEVEDQYDENTTRDLDDNADSAAQAAFIHLKLRLSNEIATNLSLGGNQGLSARAWLDSVTAAQYADPASTEQAKQFIQDLKKENASLQAGQQVDSRASGQRRTRRNKKTKFISTPSPEYDDI